MADRWLATGRASLTETIQDQFSGDGWYAQHSFSYMRVALDQCVIAQRILASRGLELSPDCVRRLHAAADLVAAVIDGDTGIVPNHGANDGAFVHPITSSPYRDFRPMLTAVSGVFGWPLPKWVKPDDETLAWLGNSELRRGTATRPRVVSGDSGWVAVNRGSVALFLRAGKYRHRPGHLDPLHLDVRIAGREIVVDAGSYSYNGPEGWRNTLAAGYVHNGPLLDGRELGVRGPRFLWLVWPEAHLQVAADTEESTRIEAERPGLVHRRVEVTSTQVKVVDSAVDPRARFLSVRWLVHPEASPSSIQMTEEPTILVASEQSTVGWFSPHYGQRLRGASVEAVVALEARQTLTSIIQ